MKPFLKVEIEALIPNPYGCAVFLKNEEKNILFYIDNQMGSLIHLAMQGEQIERPLTHDLFLQSLNAFGAKVTRVCIVDEKDGVFFARLWMETLDSPKKYVEIDARPSDCLALAVRTDVPIFFKRSLWECCSDMSDSLDTYFESLQN